jgi:hypothetical protein
MGFLFKKKKKFRTFTESPSSNAINKNNYKNFLVKAISLIKGDADTRESLSAPEFDLAEIREASEADSYIKMSLMKYSYMLFKAGYLIKSENEEASNYIKTRFYIMSFSTGKPIDILFQELGDDLIKYSNAFIVKSRVKSIMNGVTAKGFYKDNPIGGYFRIDPSTITIQRDKNGTIKNYVQSVDGEEKTFAPTEVIHFYLDKEAANAFGTPRILPALEDVKILRRIEGNIMTLIHRFSMPLFQWKIGLAQTGFQATDKEIDEARREIETMPMEGSVVTNEKTDIKSVGAEGTALNAQAYLTYFENRVFSALGVSQSQMGRGATGSNADSMESQAHDTVKYIQKIFRIFLENMVINELLLEGGFNPVINEDDRVNFVFNEISLDTRIKLENHQMNQFQSNMITFQEMRREIGRKEDVDTNDLYQFMIQNQAEEELVDAQTEASINIAGEQHDDNMELAQFNADAALQQSKVAAAIRPSNASGGSSSSSGSGKKGVNPKGNGTNKSTKPNKSVSNTNQPANQHGKTSVKIKESLSFEEKLINSKRNHKKSFEAIYNKYDNLRNDIIDNPQDMDLLLPLALTNIMEEIKMNMQLYSLQGINKATDDIEKLKKEKLILPHIKISLTAFEDEAKVTLQNVLKDIQKRLKDDLSESNINSVFDVLEYRIRFMLEFILPKVYWFSYLKTGAAFNYDSAYIDFGDSEDVKDYNKTIDIGNINIDKIPPFHSFCSCKITFKKGAK